MSVCCECYVLSGRSLCDELITRPDESYRLWRVVVCDQETSWMRRPWLALGCSVMRNTTNKQNLQITSTIYVLHKIVSLRLYIECKSFLSRIREEDRKRVLTNTYKWFQFFLNSSYMNSVLPSFHKPHDYLLKGALQHWLANWNGSSLCCFLLIAGYSPRLENTFGVRHVRSCVYKLHRKAI
jgi:hypothetical protein